MGYIGLSARAKPIDIGRIGLFSHDQSHEHPESKLQSMVALHGWLRGKIKER